jgi:hypothetical protein
MLNVLLIPFCQRHWGNGGIGAAVATVMTELGIMISFLSLLPTGLLSGFRVGFVTKCLAGGALMAGSQWVLSILGAPWFVLAIGGPFLYLFLLIVMKTFEPGEKQLAIELLQFKAFQSWFGS